MMAYKITQQPLTPALLQAFQQPTFQQNPMLSLNLVKPETSFYGRMFDRMTPQNENSPYALEDEQKKRLFRQGLLQFGVAALQPNGGNTGAAIARGLLAGTTGLNDGARQYTEDAYKAEKMRTGLMGDTPTDYREFDLLSKAGNLSAEDRAKAARIKLRLEGGAATGGYSFRVIKDANGNERIVRTDPRDPNPDTGVMVYDETAGGFVPAGNSMGGGQAVASAGPAQAAGFPSQQDYGPAETDNYVRRIMGNVGALDPSMPPEQMAQAILPHLIQQESAGNPNAVSPKGARGLTQVMPATGQDPGFGVAPLRDNSPQENVRFGRDYLTAMLKRYPGRPDLALAAYNAGPGVADRVGRRPASPSLLVGQSAEEEAAAKARVALQYATPMADVDVRAAEAKARAALQAQLDFAPDLGRVEADIEGDKTAARTAAETQAAASKRLRDAKETIPLMADASRLLKKATGGRVGAVADAVGSAFNYTSEGLAANAQLRVLAAKLVFKVERFEGPQSNPDVQGYKEAAGDLANELKPVGERLAALKQMQVIEQRILDREKNAALRGGESAPANDDDAIINKYLRR